MMAAVIFTDEQYEPAGHVALVSESQNEPMGQSVHVSVSSTVAMYCLFQK
jgi:hypothetical protein